MDWLLVTPQIHGAFASLGCLEGDKYVVSPNVLAILEEINHKLIFEDQLMRPYRRVIGFGGNVSSDLIPLLENTKDDVVLDSVIRILVNLTVPVECLFSLDSMYRTEVGRHTVFELNKLLYASKKAFLDPKSTKPVMEYIEHLLESETKLSLQKCDQINNCLLLLRNILHIPESNSSFIITSPSELANGERGFSMQNMILWNLFIQSIDKLLIYLMTCPQHSFWGVTIVQLIALIYKDQHVSTLQKLLSMWFEASLSESSDDNESNTSPPKQCSGDSSPMLTSDPTSDSSDNCSAATANRRQVVRVVTGATLLEVSRKGQVYQNAMRREPAEATITHELRMELGSDTDSEAKKAAATARANFAAHQKPAEHITCTSSGKRTNGNDVVAVMPPPLPIADVQRDILPKGKGAQKVPHAGLLNLIKGKSCPQKRECQSSTSELSDCGYATQAENQGSQSTSSNEDEGKPEHQKPPCSTKLRNKQRIILNDLDIKELRRKKLVKRSKSTLINMKCLVQHKPTDEDISNLLKEFTLDFLLKGYGYLVKDLHMQLLTNVSSIDTSHFFWLVTYFLKFAAQLELDMDHIMSVLTFDIISYLAYEGVTMCELLEIDANRAGSDIKTYLRRMHLVVTAIREFLQALDTYKKVAHLSEHDRELLQRLQVQISTSEDLRSMFVLLLRRYNSTLQTRKYLSDLVVTNHMLLLILDEVTRDDSTIKIDMKEHVAQFASLEVMNYYGLLLEDFKTNGELVNDCIFTMMHHIAGDLDQVGFLFQPNILKTFSLLWETEFELCDDWSDLIEYVIHKFTNTTQNSPLAVPTASLTELTKEHNLENTTGTWTQEEMEVLYWYYVQSKKTSDIIGKICQLFSNNGNRIKTRLAVIHQLLQQDIITLVEYDDLMKYEDAEYQRALLGGPSGTAAADYGIGMGRRSSKTYDDIQILCNLIIKEDKEEYLIWLQKTLLECCYIKLTLRKAQVPIDHSELEHIMEPVAHHCILKRTPIPIVQWNNSQASAMLYQPFILLMHKLDLQLPTDSEAIYARIPDYLTPEMMFGMAKKLGPLDRFVLKFDARELEEISNVDALPELHYHQQQQSAGEMVDSSYTDVVTPDMHDAIFGSRYDGTHRPFRSLSPIAELDTRSERDVFAMPRPKPASATMRHMPAEMAAPTATPAVPNWLQLVMRNKCSPASAMHAPSADNDLYDMCMSRVAGPAGTSTQSLTAATGTASVTSTRQKAALEAIAAAALSAMTTPSAAQMPHNGKPTISSAAMAAVVREHQQQIHQQQPQAQQAQQAPSQQTTAVRSDGTARNKLERHDSNSSGYNTRSAGDHMESEYGEMIITGYDNEQDCSDSSIISDLTRMYVSDEDERLENHRLGQISN